MSPLARCLSIVAVVLVASCSLPPRGHAQQLRLQYVSNLTAANTNVVGVLERQVGTNWVVEPTTVVAPTVTGKTAALLTVQNFSPGTYTFRVWNEIPVGPNVPTALRSVTPTNSVTHTIATPPPPNPTGLIITLILGADGIWREVS